MPGMTGQFGGEAQAVGDDRQPAPATARLEMAGDRQGRRAGIEHDALAVAGRGSPPRPRSAPSRRPGAARGSRTRAPGRLRSTAMAPPWVRTRRRSASSAIRSLRMVTADTPNWLARSVTRARPLLVDDPDDPFLSFAGEDVARGDTRCGGHASPRGGTRGDDSAPIEVSFGFRAHSRPYRNAMSRR